MKKASNKSDSVSDDKIFSASTVLVGGIIFGIPAFAYLVYVNLRNMGYPRLAKKIGILISLVFLLTLPLLFIINVVFDISVPTGLVSPVSITFVVAIYFYYLKILMEQHKAKAGRYYGLARSAVVMAISTVIVIAYILGYFWVLGKKYNFSLGETLQFAAVSGNYDADFFDRQSDMIIHNEEAALKILDPQKTASKEEWIAILQEGIGLWNKNIVILNQMASMKYLPNFMKEDIADQKKYTELRIEEYKLLVLKEQEQTDVYDARIDNVRLQLEQIIDKINKKS